MNPRSSSLPQSAYKSRAFPRRPLSHAAAAAASLAMLLAAQNARAAARTWVGSTSTDWAVVNGFNTVPVSGDSLVFGADGAAGTAAGDVLTNSTTTSAFNVAGITFNAGAPAYTMTGNTFNLTAGITNNSSNLQTFSNTGGLNMSGSLTFALGSGGITLTNGLTNTSATNNTTLTANGAGSTLTLGTFVVFTTTNRVGFVVNGSGNVNVTGNITSGDSVDNLTYSGTGTLTIGGGFAFNSNGSSLNVSSGTIRLTSAQAGAPNNITGTGAFVETSAGSILNNGGAFGGFNQNSTGTSILSGTNTYQNATAVNAGTLLLDFSATTAPATATNIINSTANSSALTLGGGTLSINGGGAGDTNSQRFNGTTLTASTSSKISFTQNGDTNLSATLGGLTRNAGSTLDITLPTAGTVSTTSTTFATNGVLTSAAANGNAFATVNGGTAFASNTAGTIGAITPVAGTYGATANVSVGAADTPASGAGANTLTFNGAAGSVAFTGINAITAGGILLTPTASGASAISGGTVSAGAGRELTIFNNEPAASGSLTISSIIADNAAGASALTIAGAGTTVLTNANTFSGQTSVLRGSTLNFSNALAAQNSTVQVNTGSALVFDQSVTGNAFTLGGLSGSGNLALVNNATPSAPIALTVGGNNAATTYGGVLSGAGSLIKNGTGTLSTSQNQTYTGGLTINNGGVAAANSTNSFGSTGTLTLGQSGVANNVSYSATGFNNPITVNPGLVTSPGTATRTINPNTGTSFTLGGAITLVGGATLTISSSNATITSTGGATGTGNIIAGSSNQGTTFSTGVLNMTGFFQNSSNGANSPVVNSVIGPNVTAVIENPSNVASGLVLTAANTFPGDTTITKGFVNLRNALALQKSVVVTNSTAGSLTFGTSATSGLNAATLGGLAGNGNVGLNDTFSTPNAVALTIGNSNVANGSAANPNTLNPSYDGVLSNGTSTGAATVTKVGSNTQTFTGVNTYTGTTTVTAGTLALAATTGAAAGGSTAIAVYSGGTLRLATPNQVNAAAPITLGTGAFATPPATTGILSFAAGANQGSAATVTGGTVMGNVTTGGTVTGTTLAGLGTLTLNNTSTLVFSGASTTLVFNGLTIFPDGNGNDAIVTISGYSNTTSSTPGSSGAGVDDRLVFQGDQAGVLADFDFGAGPGVGVSEIALDNGFYEVAYATPVPEPASVSMLGGALVLGAMAWQYRRRSHRAVG